MQNALDEVPREDKISFISWNCEVISGSEVSGALDRISSQGLHWDIPLLQEFVAASTEVEESVHGHRVFVSAPSADGRKRAAVIVNASFYSLAQFGAWHLTRNVVAWSLNWKGRTLRVISAHFEVNSCKSVFIEFLEDVEVTCLAPYFGKEQFVVGLDAQDALGCPFTKENDYHVGALAWPYRSFKGKMLRDLLRLYNLRVADSFPSTTDEATEAIFRARTRPRRRARPPKRRRRHRSVSSSSNSSSNSSSSSSQSASSVESSRPAREVVPPASSAHRWTRMGPSPHFTLYQIDHFLTSLTLPTADVFDWSSPVPSSSDHRPMRMTVLSRSWDRRVRWLLRCSLGLVEEPAFFPPPDREASAPPDAPLPREWEPQPAPDDLERRTRKPRNWRLPRDSATNYNQTIRSSLGLVQPSFLEDKFFSDSSVFVYVDGSYQRFYPLRAVPTKPFLHGHRPDAAGWSHAWFKDQPSAAGFLRASCGNVELRDNEKSFIGAFKASNITGELSGVVHALLQLATDLAQDKPLGSTYLILTDCKLIVDVIEKRSVFSNNVKLACFMLFLFGLLSTLVPLRIAHVRAHVGLFGNEVADRLAKIGASPSKCSQWSGGDYPNLPIDVQTILHHFSSCSSSLVEFQSERRFSSHSNLYSFSTSSSSQPLVETFEQIRHRVTRQAQALGVKQ